MKNLKRVFVVLLVVVLSSCATTREVRDFKTVEKTVVVEDASREELFDRANVWLIHEFGDTKKMVKWRNNVQGTVVSKYVLHIAPFFTTYSTEVTMEIYTEENKAFIRIKPDPILYIRSGHEDFTNKLKYVDDDMRKLAESFEKWVKTKQL